MEIKRENIIGAIKDVRNSGLVNMFDLNGVVLIMRSLGNRHEALYLLSAKDSYVNFILSGKESHFPEVVSI